MSAFISTRTALSLVRTTVSGRWYCRSLGTVVGCGPAGEDGMLPLKGIKVLDMTRVLAGVSDSFFFFLFCFFVLEEMRKRGMVWLLEVGK